MRESQPKEKDGLSGFGSNHRYQSENGDSHARIPLMPASEAVHTGVESTAECNVSPEVDGRAPKQRNLNLDVLRGIAVLMILGRHFKCFSLWTKIGWAGVDLFFVLSGFLISGLLFEEWKRRGSIDIRRFYIRRGFKLYPSFYALIVLTAILAPIFPRLAPHPVSLRPLISEALFLQSYLPSVWGITWSLAVEEHFYLVLPLLLVVMQRWNRQSADPFRAIVSVFAVVSIIDIALRIAGGRDFIGEWPGMFQTHLRIDALLFGVSLGYYRHFRPDLFRELAESRTAMMICISVLPFLLVVDLASPIMHTVGFTLVFFGFGVLLARTIDFAPGRCIFLLRPFAMIGTYSYSIYVWHAFVLRTALHAHLPGSLFGLTGIVASILFGVLMAKLVELPALRLRDNLFAPITLHNAPKAIATARARNAVEGLRSQTADR